MQEKARGVGFDWQEADPVREKVMEEWQELHEAEADKQEEEYGDLLFALVNYGRFLKINPEDALERANRKFQRRFQFIETRARQSAIPLTELSLEEMEEFWQEAKKEGL